MKTLIFILNYNTPDLTDSLFESLQRECNGKHDLLVLDNNSDDEKKSKYPTIQTGENLYWGGGLNYAFKYILENKQYDSLLFMNSDLIVKEHNFVTTLRDAMFNEEFMIVSPSFIEDYSKNKRKSVTFPQMGNWETKKCRQVKWIDLQCPLFNRKFIESVNQFDPVLKLGYGIDLLCGFMCEDKNWKIGVHDKLLTQHLGQESWKRENKLDEYMSTAGKQYHVYFRRRGMRSKRKEYMQYSGSYCIGGNS